MRACFIQPTCVELNLYNQTSQRNVPCLRMNTIQLKGEKKTFVSILNCITESRA